MYFLILDMCNKCVIKCSKRLGMQAKLGCFDGYGNLVYDMSTKPYHSGPKKHKGLKVLNYYYYSISV
jgi:hypothetical protein